MGKEIKMTPKNEKQISINPSDLEDVVCEKCKAQTFELAFLFKKLSAIMSPTGKDTLIPLQVYRCTECGNINDGFLPKENPSA